MNASPNKIDPHPLLITLLAEAFTTAKEARFETLQNATFLSIVLELHLRCVNNPYMKLELDYGVFKQLVLVHSVERPPLSKMIFTNLRKKLLNMHLF